MTFHLGLKTGPADEDTVAHLFQGFFNNHFISNLRGRSHHQTGKAQLNPCDI